MSSPESPIGSTEQLAAAQTNPGRTPGIDPGASADGMAGTPMRPNDSQGTRDGGAAEHASQLLDPDVATEMARRWDDIQTGFVDQPRQAVSDADTLVAELIGQLTRMFADERTRLEAGLDADDQASTEDLRVGLRRYRDFFQRLLTT